MALSYNDLQFPVYRNSAVVMSLNGEADEKPKRVDLTFSDVMYAAELSGLNGFLLSDTGRGKTQLVSDIYNAHFGGEGNWTQGRREMNVMDLFEVTRADLTGKKFDSDQARQLLEERVSCLLNVVDELNRAPGPVQADCFDLADGKYAFKGKPIRLGREGYSLFLATANINKAGDNGFTGTFEVDRALWNRAHLTIDLDHKAFRPTADDLLAIRERHADPRVKYAEPKDLSAEILAAHKRIKEQARQPLLEARIFGFLIDAGLDYCRKDDLLKEKQGTFPMKCLDCPHIGDICSQVKSSSERTVESVALLAHALGYVAELKYGEVALDPFDLLTHAFRFTSYHGNLNEVIANDTYAGRRQLMMDRMVNERLGPLINIIRAHVSDQRLYPLVLEYTDNGTPKKIYTPQTKGTEGLLKKKRIQYQTLDLSAQLEEKGVGSDWVKVFTAK